MTKVKHVWLKLWYKYLKPKPKPEPPSIKDIINANFKKIQDEIEKNRVTTEILIEDLERKAKAINLLTKVTEEICDRLKSLELDKH